MAHTLRTRIKKEIIVEFLPPAKPSKKVIILCGGMPGYPDHKELIIALSKKGYWTFSPRYRGTWESGGSFLKYPPQKDIIDLIEVLPSGFLDLWNKRKITIKNPEVYLIGSSFGGPAALLASKHSSVKKVVVLSPVTDWSKESKIEPLNWLELFTRNAFGNGYRFSHKNWKKLKTSNFYNPTKLLKKIDPKKVFVIYTKDDAVVPPESTSQFIKLIECKSLYLKSGGHLSFSTIITPKIWKKISWFFALK